jgi:hypothetical protein
VIKLDPVFAETVNTGVNYYVFLTPSGDCQGLYVAAKGPVAFTVQELNGGQSDIGFDFRIVARRKGYESVRLPNLRPGLQLPQPSSTRRVTAE